MMVTPRQTKARAFCPTCGLSNIRPSPRRGFVDGALVLLGLAPFRCRNCRRRFYRFSSRKGNEVATAGESTAPRPARTIPAVYEPAPAAQPVEFATQTLRIAGIPEEESQELARAVEETPAILVLDSDLSIRRLLRRILEREGYRTYELGHSGNLIAELRRTSVDLLITDLDLPFEEGLKALSTLQREFPGLQVIVLSGFWAAENLRERVPGASAVLAKPFRTEALLESVGTVLAHTQAPSAIR